MPSNIEHEIPAGVGVKTYTVRRDRSEVSFISLDYYDEGAKRWISDVQCEPEERKDVDVTRHFLHPDAFKASDHRILLRLTGKWKPDHDRLVDFDHIGTNQQKDMVSLFFMAKKDDANATVVAKIFYTKDIPFT